VSIQDLNRSKSKKNELYEKGTLTRRSARRLDGTDAGKEVRARKKTGAKRITKVIHSEAVVSIEGPHSRKRSLRNRRKKDIKGGGKQKKTQVGQGFCEGGEVALLFRT